MMSGKNSAEIEHQIIPLKPSDLDQIYQLDLLCFPKTIAFSRELFHYCLISPDCVCFGIKQNQKLLGFIIIQARTKEKAQLLTLDVAPDQRRKKIGQHLLEYAHHFLKSSGFKSIFLETAVNNHPALRLYQKLGYLTRGIKPNYYPDGTDAYLMEKTL